MAALKTRQFQGPFSAAFWSTSNALLLRYCIFSTVLWARKNFDCASAVATLFHRNAMIEVKALGRLRFCFSYRAFFTIPVVVACLCVSVRVLAMHRFNASAECGPFQYHLLDFISVLALCRKSCQVEIKVLPGQLFLAHIFLVHVYRIFVTILIYTEEGLRWIGIDIEHERRSCSIGEPRTCVPDKSAHPP